MLGDSVGRDEYIDQKHGRFRQIKAASGWLARRVTGTGFGCLFTQTRTTGTPNMPMTVVNIDF